jgi:glycosyltransferase involved in cell wall biosynthesis
MRLVAPGDREGLAAAIRSALDDDGDAARANVIANFTWEQCGKATLAAYEDALR